jgi:hypothetical protein
MTTAPELPPATGWSTPLRIATAIALVLGGGFQLLSELLLPPTPDYVGSMAAHPDKAEFAAAADMLAVPFLIATAIAWTVPARPLAPRLAWTGSALMITGLCALAALIGATTAQHWSLDLGVDPAVVARIFDVGDLPLVVLLVLFLSAPLGILLLVVGMWRARSVPRGALVLAVAFVAVDFTPLGGLAPFPTHAILLAALVWMAVAVLRRGTHASASARVHAH